MRKLIMFLGRVPSSIRNAARNALKITTAWRQALESDTAIMLTRIIPGTVDDTLREAIIAILKSMQPYLQEAHDAKIKKAIAARAAAEIVAVQDGHKERMGQYSIWFEQVYKEESKTA